MATLNTTSAVVQPDRSTLIAVAWGSMLLPASVPWIWSLWTGTPMPFWINWVGCGGVLLLWLLALTWPGLRPLRNYLLALLVLLAADALRNQLLVSPAFTTWTKTAGWGVALVADRALRWFPTLLLLLTAVATGRRRRDVFLAKGDLQAPVQPNALFKKPRPWIAEAREFIVYFSLGIIIFNWLLLHPDLTRLAQALVNLPLILLGAALNSSGEEVRFRAVLMGQLVPALGARQALWLQATFFGLVHWAGNPSGPLGVLMAGFLGWFLGKSVLETRGLAIAVTSHFLLNIIQGLMFALVQA